MHLSRLFDRSVRMFADRPAMAQGTQAALSYRDLARRVDHVAGYLRSGLGLEPGDRVCLAMKNSVGYMVAMLAIWRAGLCAVPVNSKLHPSEVRYIVADSGARLCLHDGELHVRGGSAGDDGDAAWLDVTAEAWKGVEDRSGEPGRWSMRTAERGSGEDLAWLFYTSGTTGRPKGVMLTHANLVAMALNFHADMLAIGPDDVLLHVAPLSHGSGLYGIAYWMHGALQVVPESGGFDEAELSDLLCHYDRASLFAAPTIITRMVRHLSREPRELRGLRCFFAGGAPFYAEDIKAAVACFGPRVAQMYGQGETPMTIAALPAAHVAQAVAHNDMAMLSSVGYAQTTVDIEILDEHGTRLPEGQAGEIVVRSPTVMKGYWRNPEATARTLRGAGLWTGDIGVVDERGLLHLKDRSKDVIISGGSNIYPREVEDALLAHPGVREVAVIGVPDPEWGESVMAFVVAEAGVAEQALNATCLASIARFKRPKHYRFVDSLPKNPTGKVIKSELRSKAASAGAA